MYRICTSNRNAGKATMAQRRSTASEDIGGEVYPIRTVSTLTGVNAITLRAWERRYGLIKPVRTAKGHRLYTRGQIDLINRVMALLEKGMSISQVGQALRQTPSAPGAGAGEAAPWPQYRERMVSAITRFDEGALENVYNDALSVYPVEIVTRKLLLPLLEELGRRWESAEGSVAEEHFFGVYLRNKLGARFHHRGLGNVGPRLLGACLPGEQHEIGLLLFALAVHEAGFGYVLLGANMPLEDLPVACRRAGSDAVVLSSSVDAEPDVIGPGLTALVAAVSVPVFVGGLTSVRQRDAILAAGATPLGNDIHVGIRRIADILSVPEPD